MAKLKHINVLEQTIVRQMPFDPNNLAAAAATEDGMTSTARAMVGYVSATTKMKKVPAPTTAPAAVESHDAAE